MEKEKNKQISTVEKGFLKRFSENDGSLNGVTVDGANADNIAESSESEQNIREHSQTQAQHNGSYSKTDITESCGGDNGGTYIRRYEEQLYTREKVEGWMREAKEIAEKYPDFDLRRAVKDKRFLGMLRAGVSILDSHRALNYDGIFKAELEKVMAGVYDDIRARGMRPHENGIVGSGGVNIGLGARSFSRKERAEIAKRVENGEKIVL